MDEHAIRARAGLINIVTWIALMNVLFWKNKIFAQILFPLVVVEFLSSMPVGLTPVAPIDVLGSLLVIVEHPEPHWKPAKPKRFAWAPIGLTLVTLCLAFFLLRDELADTYRPLVGLTVLTYNVAIWLESSCIFCLGCFVYYRYLVKLFDLEECPVQDLGGH